MFIPTNQQYINVLVSLGGLVFIQTKSELMAVPYDLKSLPKSLGIHLHTHEYICARPYHLAVHAGTHMLSKAT